MTFNFLSPDAEADIPACVARALQEDIGSGDITAQLIPSDQSSSGYVITREQAVVCGRPWVDEVYRQLDGNVSLEWLVTEGDVVMPEQRLFNIHGNTRSLLTGERTALNFLQTLCGTASKARRFAKLIEGSHIKILDTRKTIPGLRLAQKYAVRIGGCDNHRIGLYDAYLIKENHIAACGSISLAVERARQAHPNKLLEVEVENLDQLQEALDAQVDVVMLDNFSENQLAELEHIDTGATSLEISGNITETQIKRYANLPINYLSSGSLTKHVDAIDLSMRIIL